jgi:POT family proton-dependent oligopeptide transporter
MTEPESLPPRARAVVGAEALERFAFHGLCAVLALYLNEHLLYAEREARGVTHLFLAAAYLAPLAGRVLAARLGLVRTVAWASALHLAGLVLLAAVESRAGLALGLALVAAGAGAAKPATSALLGERLRGGRDRAARVNAALYRAVNGASLAAKLGVPIVLVAWGPRAAFATAAAALAAGILVARPARAGLGAAKAPPRDPHGFLRVIARAVSRLGMGRPGERVLDHALDAHPPEAVEGARAVLRLAPVFAALTLFWALFDQRVSAWVFQARQLDLTLFGLVLSPAQLQALEPLLVVVLVPLLGRVVFPALERRGIALPPLRKVSAGLFAAAAAFVAAAVLQHVVDAGRVPHALWQVPQYVLLALGEVLVSVTGLELAYAQAPRAMRGTIMSIGFLTVFAGNLLTAAVGRLFRLDGPRWYWAFAVLGVAGAVAFRWATRRWGVAWSESDETDESCEPAAG